MVDNDIRENGNTFIVIRINALPKRVKPLRETTHSIILTVNIVIGKLRFQVNCQAVRDASLIGLNFQQISIFLKNPANSIFNSRSYFHTAPIFFRCPCTRAASVATSLASCGSGVAYRSASWRMRPVRVCET